MCTPRDDREKYQTALAQGDPNPEISLAHAFKSDLNVDINPQALRMFIRTRWSRVSTLAHKIHEA